MSLSLSSGPAGIPLGLAQEAPTEAEGDGSAESNLELRTSSLPLEGDRFEVDRGPLDHLGWGSLEDLYVDLGAGAAVNVFSEEHKTCNCSKRKKFFNWIGGHLGLAPGMDAEIHAMTLDEQPLRNCAIHGKCICDEVFPDSVLESIRSNGIEPCQHCSDFEKEIK